MRLKDSEADLDILEASSGLIKRKRSGIRAVDSIDWLMGDALHSPPTHQPTHLPPLAREQGED